MALIKITTNNGAIGSSDMERMTQALGNLTYGAEGFSESKLAPTLTWIVVQQLPKTAFLTAAALSSAPLYLIEITTLQNALNLSTKQSLGAQMTETILAAEGCASTPANAARVWVRFTDVADGDLVVAGQSASLAGLRALIAQEGNS